MKLFISTAFILISVSSIFAQESRTAIFDEISISVNRTLLKSVGTNNRIGVGFEATHTFFPESRLNLMLGVGNNYTGLYKSMFITSRFSHYSNATFHIIALSTPLGLRLNIGSKRKVFLESGAFTDIVLFSKVKGIKTVSVPSGNTISFTKKEVFQRVGLSSYWGLYLGIGLRVPLFGYDFIIKPEYKLGASPLHSYYENVNNRYIRINLVLKFK